MLDIVVKEKPIVGSPFFRAFPSDRVLKVTKDVSAHFFIHSSNFRKLYQQIPVKYTGEFWELFEGTTYISWAMQHLVICAQDLSLKYR